jgi:hypothetical protein
LRHSRWSSLAPSFSPGDCSLCYACPPMCVRLGRLRGPAGARPGVSPAVAAAAPFFPTMSRFPPLVSPGRVRRAVRPGAQAIGHPTGYPGVRRAHRARVIQLDPGAAMSRAPAHWSRCWSGRDLPVTAMREEHPCRTSRCNGVQSGGGNSRPASAVASLSTQAITPGAPPRACGKVMGARWWSPTRASAPWLVQALRST